MLNLTLTIFGKLIFKIIKIFHLGSGSTWPGHIALRIDKNFIFDKLKRTKIKTLLIAGTNGKTTTGKLIQSILEKNGNTVLINQEGANLLNGVASALILGSDALGRINKDYAIFEVDENTVPLVLEQMVPDFFIGLNLFRDQLDRYGEVNTIAKKWKNSFRSLPKSTTLILNADDPLISYLSDKIYAKVLYFGLDNEKFANCSKQCAADSIYCPFCQNRLSFKEIYFSHLGNWYCKKCNRKRNDLIFKDVAKTSLIGIYNLYNVLAACLFTRTVGVPSNKIFQALSSFKPAFGRQEQLEIDGKKVYFFLSKNPTSFNESLRTSATLKGRDLLIILNDRIPDGTDISWIWDIDMENLLTGFRNITVSGDRVYDMALRIKYATDVNFTYEPKLELAVKKALLGSSKTLAILPTYSAMLDVRKILSGRKIL